MPYCSSFFPIPFPLLSFETNNISSILSATPMNPSGLPFLFSATTKTGTSFKACGTYCLILFISSADKNRWVAFAELSHTSNSSYYWFHTAFFLTSENTITRKLSVIILNANADRRPIVRFSSLLFNFSFVHWLSGLISFLYHFFNIFGNRGTVYSNTDI